MCVAESPSALVSLASVLSAAFLFVWPSLLLSASLKDHQTEQKLNKKEVKWVSGPSSLLCLQDEEEGESEGIGLCHGGKHVASKGVSGELDGC